MSCCFTYSVGIDERLGSVLTELVGHNAFEDAHVSEVQVVNYQIAVAQNLKLKSYH